jgi:hypothetical protein
MKNIILILLVLGLTSFTLINPSISYKLLFNVNRTELVGTKKVNLDSLILISLNDTKKDLSFDLNVKTKDLYKIKKAHCVGYTMYFNQMLIERLKLKNAASNPKNSTAPAPRKNSAEMLAARDKALKAAGKVKGKRVRSPESVQRNLERKDDRQQGKDARRDPKRYEHPLNDRGVSMNIRMKEIVEKADAAIKTASARKAKEREKIAKTPDAKAKVNATLAAKKRADKAEAARLARNTLRNRTGKPGLRSGGMGGGGLINRNTR